MTQTLSVVYVGISVVFSSMMASASPAMSALVGAMQLASILSMVKSQKSGVFGTATPVLSIETVQSDSRNSVLQKYTPESGKKTETRAGNGTEQVHLYRDEELVLLPSRARRGVTDHRV